jgi:Uma2 family endonuclease
MKARKISNISFADYIQQEMDTNTKYEYHNGKIYALAGGTLNHGLISGNVFSKMTNKLEEKSANCTPLNSDVKLHIAYSNSYVYPDSMVVCGEFEYAEEDENSITNPILIVEVLSKSTAEYDRGDKFYLYRQIPTLREYVLIEQNKYVVDVHYKSDNSDLWKISRYQGLDEIVKFQSVDIEISMSALYKKAKIDLE